MVSDILKIAMCALIILCGWLLVKNQQTPIKEASKGLITPTVIEAKKIADKVDKKGFRKAVFERKNEIIGTGDISKLPISKAIFDSLRLDNLEKRAKLQQASLIIGKLEAHNLRAKMTIDSLNKKQYLYADSFATARFTLDSVGTGFFDIDYRINLIRHDYKIRSWFLAPYKYQTDILSPDYRVKINGLHVLSIYSQKPTRWGVGVFGGYGYNFTARMFSPMIGLGVSYNIIRW